MNNIQIGTNADGKLVITKNQIESIAAIAVRCFPWSNNNKFISLRCQKGNEIAMIKDLELLDKGSRICVEQALSETSFVLHISQIFRIETEFEIRSWHVETRQGFYKFQTKLDEWPQSINKHGLFIRDVSGNLFQIDNINKLDRTSKNLIWPYLD